MRVLIGCEESQAVTKGQAHRAEIRSKTFQGIADQMAAQWSKTL